MSLINLGGGLSAAGQSISSFAGNAGMAQQKADLEKQQLVLADQLKDASETKMAGINQANALARIPVQGAQDVQTAQASAEAQGAQQRQTRVAANALPMSAVQKATTDADTTRAAAAMLEAKKPVSAGYSGNGWLVPDSKDPSGYRVINSTPTTPTGPLDPTSNNLTAQTGLSDNAIQVATGKLTGRYAAPFRAELQAWGVKNGKNVDTLIPQAQAADAILKTNIERNNQGNILEHEISGSIDNAADLAKTVDLGSVKAANVLAVWAGKEVNDPTAVKVADQLGRLRDELAGYNAIAGGHLGDKGQPMPSPDDKHAAETVISNGISSGGLKALGQSIAMSAQKNRAVLEQSINDASTQYYNLFGAKYHAPEHADAAPTAIGADNAAPKATAPGTLMGKTPDGRDVIAGPDGKPHVRGQ